MEAQKEQDRSNQLLIHSNPNQATKMNARKLFLESVKPETDKDIDLSRLGKSKVQRRLIEIERDTELQLLASKIKRENFSRRMLERSYDGGAKPGPGKTGFAIPQASRSKARTRNLLAATQKIQ